MYVLRIEHPIPDYSDWKKAFDDDPLGRNKTGVRRHRVLRDADSPNVVMVDLEFETIEAAQAMHEALKQLWGRVQGEGLIGGPKATVAELVESREY